MVFNQRSVFGFLAVMHVNYYFCFPTRGIPELTEKPFAALF